MSIDYIRRFPFQPVKPGIAFPGKIIHNSKVVPTDDTSSSGKSDINSKQPKCPDIRIVDLRVYIQNQPTKVDEFSNLVVKYKTPKFKASATFQFPPIVDNTMWKVGWVQACTSMFFHITYGSAGYTSWEFPEMKSNEKFVINDSDGRNYPFYGSSTQVAYIPGPKTFWSEHYITMLDLFNPCIPWRGPSSKCPKTGNKRKTPKLTRIERDQSFLVWLVAMNTNTKECFVLKTIRWEVYLNISVNVERPLGFRTKLESDPVPKQPILFNFNIPIPIAALYPPCANAAQVLMWRPTDGPEVLLVPPKYVVINKQSYVNCPIDEKEFESTDYIGEKENMDDSYSTLSKITSENVFDEKSEISKKEQRKPHKKSFLTLVCALCTSVRGNGG